MYIIRKQVTEAYPLNLSKVFQESCSFALQLSSDSFSPCLAPLQPPKSLLHMLPLAFSHNMSYQKFNVTWLVVLQDVSDMFDPCMCDS